MLRGHTSNARGRNKQMQLLHRSAVPKIIYRSATCRFRFVLGNSAGGLCSDGGEFRSLRVSTQLVSQAKQASQHDACRSRGPFDAPRSIVLPPANGAAVGAQTQHSGTTAAAQRNTAGNNAHNGATPQSGSVHTLARWENYCRMIGPPLEPAALAPIRAATADDDARQFLRQSDWAGIPIRQPRAVA